MPVRETADDRMNKLFAQNSRARLVVETFNNTKDSAKRVASALLDKEFWREDILRNADVAARNVVAQTAGLPSDMVGLMMMVRAADPVHGPMIMSKLGVDNIWEVPNAIPGNSEQIAGWVGGDPNHASWLPGAFISPGPGEIKGVMGATLGGAAALGRRGEEAMAVGMQKYAEFLKIEKARKMKPMDFSAVQETGWVRGFDGKPKFLIDDSAATVRNIDLIEGDNVYTLGEVLDHPTLYEYYPDLANVKVTLKAERADDGSIRYVSQRQQGEPIANLRYSKSKPSEINVFQARNLNSLKGSLLHEASHWIEEVEGWSTGATSYGIDFFAKLGDNILSNKMLKELTETELSNPDKVAEYLKAAGISADQAPELMQTARIYANLGQDAINRAVGASDFMIKQELTRSAHVFEYILKKGEVADQEKIDTLFKSLSTPEKRAVLVELSDEAYNYKLGEVEARLADFTKNWDIETYNKATDPVETMLRAEAGGLAPEGVRLSDDIVIGERAPGAVSQEATGLAKLLDETYLTPTDRQILQDVVDKDPEILIKWLRELEGAK